LAPNAGRINPAMASKSASLRIPTSSEQHCYLLFDRRREARVRRFFEGLDNSLTIRGPAWHHIARAASLQTLLNWLQSIPSQHSFASYLAPCHTLFQEIRKTMPRHRPSFGARTQVTGGLALLIGIYLHFFGPAPVPGVPINPRYLAWSVLGSGISLLVGGTLMRIFSRRPPSS
jgi:hypothetical protein